MNKTLSYTLDIFKSKYILNYDIENVRVLDVAMQLFNIANMQCKVSHYEFDYLMDVGREIMTSLILMNNGNIMNFVPIEEIDNTKLTLDGANELLCDIGIELTWNEDEVNLLMNSIATRLHLTNTSTVIGWCDEHTIIIGDFHV